MGLGLFISFQIVKAHHGTIWVESELGKGSCFQLSLPLANPAGRLHLAETDYYKDAAIEIKYNRQKQQLEVAWKGLQDYASVKHGGTKML